MKSSESRLGNSEGAMQLEQNEQEKGHHSEAEGQKNFQQPQTGDQILEERQKIDARITSEQTSLNDARERLGLPPKNESVSLKALMEQRDRLSQLGLDMGHVEDKEVPGVTESSEKQEKRERIEKIIERVQKGFELAKERMESFGEKYDEIFGEAREKIYRLSELFPEKIEPQFIESLDQKNQAVKIADSNILALYDSANIQLQFKLHLLPIESITIGDIDSIEISINRVFDSINLHEEIVQEQLDSLQSKADSIPDMRGTREVPEKNEKIKREGIKIEEPELFNGELEGLDHVVNN